MHPAEGGWVVVVVDDGELEVLLDGVGDVVVDVVVDVDVGEVVVDVGLLGSLVMVVDVGEVVSLVEEVPVPVGVGPPEPPSLGSVLKTTSTK